MFFSISGQLWVSVNKGKVMVFDASSWSLTHTCHVGNARLVRRTHETNNQALTGLNDWFQTFLLNVWCMTWVISAKTPPICRSKLYFEGATNQKKAKTSCLRQGMKFFKL